MELNIDLCGEIFKYLISAAVQKIIKTIKNIIGEKHGSGLFTHIKKVYHSHLSGPILTSTIWYKAFNEFREGGRFSHFIRKIILISNNNLPTHFADINDNINIILADIENVILQKGARFNKKFLNHIRISKNKRDEVSLLFVDIGLLVVFSEESFSVLDKDGKHIYATYKRSNISRLVLDVVQLNNLEVDFIFDKLISVIADTIQFKHMLKMLNED